jgi:hypothetical protein
MGNGGGLMPRSLLAASEVGWLGVGGGGVGVACWAAAGQAAERARERRGEQKTSRVRANGHAVLPDHGLFFRSVGQIAAVRNRNQAPGIAHIRPV